MSPIGAVRPLLRLPSWSFYLRSDLDVYDYQVSDQDQRRDVLSAIYGIFLGCPSTFGLCAGRKELLRERNAQRGDLVRING